MVVGDLSQTFEPITIVHNDSRVSLEPFRRQFALTIPGKIKRDTSYGSTHSDMSAKEQIQNQHDMLQLNDQQLSLEDMAEIVSGSLSWVNGDNSSDERCQMLRNIIILITSGMILYSKEFPDSVPQPRLVGMFIINPMVERIRLTTGMQICFVNFSKVSVAMAHSDDIQDGKLFGKLLCNEVLHPFVQDYTPKLGQVGRNLKDFQGFSEKLQKDILYSVRPIITSVENKLGVKTSLLLLDAEVVNSQKSDIDITKFSILSNIPCLVDLVDEMSKCFHSYFLFLYS
jgi:hypothetical protein